MSAGSKQSRGLRWATRAGAGAAIAGLLALSPGGARALGPVSPPSQQHPYLAAGSTTTSSGLLQYGGGPVITGRPRVYLVFWGSGWGAAQINTNGDFTFSNDPFGGAPRVQEMFKGLGTGGELWSGVMTQYCQGVAVGATSCLNTNAHVGYPSGGALAGVYYDNQSIPTTTTKDQIAAEAYSAAKLFGNLTRDAQYVILSPTGSHPDGFNGSWCAWHLATSSSYGSIAFTNLPYVMDYSLFGACGAGQVPGSATPALDGYTITASHEYAETLTDPLPNFEPAWFNPAVGVDSGENADECHDSAAEVATATGTFALTATWSNDTGGCATSHAILPILTNVPDLIGDTLSQAGQALNAAGLVMGTKSYKVDCNNIGLVAAQNPAPGTRVVAGTYVSITIGTKPTWPAVCP